MTRDDPEAWMWAEACDAVTRAERLHRRFFELRPGPAAGPPLWQPPADVLETARSVLVMVALPGVDPTGIEAVIEGGALRVAGVRRLPPEWRDAAIHRLELPQGRFERRVSLPPGRYSAAVRHTMLNGCLLVSLDKTA
ncbi:Hsp20/alpha crystallin family protein [Roseicella frigidaeris]|uniref:Hsp20/alpha crystallin family protein n=1 Tax=Roseicella frigidaeris TaxID=2230885 RepID=A0A327M5V1_9PROT|nr:Hsp20/alpha crystallin family protein [Roseicella frigidaeris]RAI57887.1 Hsp20/alpha crystallin family protein [Roseicella frigidaeris]